ncbi:topoisomerase II [Artemisia annua]|uniref:DNA topoisomerase 2 n=1 Tax=Artemisia annua TaxID=35608 RepID=A0A2U1M0E7_ARTAN|nr:topoisomerase II [Artemisia annua]
MATDRPQNDDPMERCERTLWIWENNKMTKRTGNKNVKEIRVTIDVNNAIISVWNDGERVNAHKKDPCWKKAIRYSTEFKIETADGCKRSKKVFTNHTVKGYKPTITECECQSSENWTKVSFKPDLAKFGMRWLEGDTVALMKRRVVDLAGCLGNSVKVELDGTCFQLKTFEEYVEFYLQPSTKLDLQTSTDITRIYEKVSFVNYFATLKGGSHVDYITSQVTGFLAKFVNLKPNEIKSHLWVFVNALIDNPAFDSQTKENLTTNKDSFGSTCGLTLEFLKKVVKSDVVDRLFSYADSKRNEKLKKMNGKLDIPRLEDAYLAGTAKSGDCTLILTEGYSAKAFAMSGLSYLGQDKYGMFPLKGNLLNVREATNKKLQQNADIQNIKKILGLQDGKSYENVKELRYGHLMIMADQDPDGSHIKGLLISIFYRLWPSLLKKVKNFMCIFKTPIVKASDKNNDMVLFYTMPEYVKWKGRLGNEATKYKIKYYKGLETIESEGVEYCFANLDQHIKDLFWVDYEDDHAIELAFCKMKIKERNDWLRAPQDYFDTKEKRMRYLNFINTEFKQYVVADLQRSIPSMVDGLKPGQRKILFSAFKKPIIQEISVAQFSVYVYNHSAYHHHHGEASLVSTIIGMAQNFVGSNNVNLLQPNGQFGTRLMGGKDHASGSYINFTRLSPITRYLFHKDDELILNYLNDNGQSIEPKWFIPIIPMVLVNGSEGRGTECSSFIPNYNPREIIANLKRLLNGEAMVPMLPWYKGYEEGFEKTASKVTGYTTKGKISMDTTNGFRITELPVKKWTQDYQEFLDAALGKDIEGYTADYDDTTVNFRITMTEDQMEKAKKEGFSNKFNLTTTLSMANMHLLDAEGKLKKYDTPEQILEEFFYLRLDFYERRKTALLRELKKGVLVLENKVEYIRQASAGKIVFPKTLYERYAVLNGKGFKSSTSIERAAEQLGWEETKEEVNLEEEVAAGGYKYLLAVAYGGFLDEDLVMLENERDEKKKKFEELTPRTAKDLWLEDLDDLDIHLAVRNETLSLLICVLVLLT